MFADNLKLYLPIFSTDDCVKLQYDPNQFYSWCIKDGLSVMAEKCSQTTFSRRKQNLKCNYQINSSELMVLDLGAYCYGMTCLSNFNIDLILCSNALRLFDFITSRNCSEFKNPM